MIAELKKENILLMKRTGYGEQISMNIGRKEAIMDYITIFLTKE